jgi:spore protease
MDTRKKYMTVPAAIRELEKIEMVRRNGGSYKLDHAVTKTQKIILSSFGLDETNIRDSAEEISKLLEEQIKEVLREMGFVRDKSILIVGLGNRAVTADALGPKVIDHLAVTRHILSVYGKEAYSGEVPSISAMEPGVMAKTGIETSEMVSGVVGKTKPDFLIVIDALAARSTKRLYTTIQISNTGISPGSGVGNHRNAINQETVGVPVLAIGIPTVVDAATIVGDACEAWWHESLKEPGPFPEEVKKYFRELKNMYVTTKEIDEIIECVSFTVSEAINGALQGTI